jgi:hypothetical protein
MLLTNINIYMFLLLLHKIIANTQKMKLFFLFGLLLFLASKGSFIEDVLKGMKIIVGDSLSKCEKFQKVSTNETVIELFSKIEDLEDLKYYIFQEEIINGCLDFRNITNMLDSITDTYNKDIHYIVMAIIEAF